MLSVSKLLLFDMCISYPLVVRYQVSAIIFIFTNYSPYLQEMDALINYCEKLDTIVSFEYPHTDRSTKASQRTSIISDTVLTIELGVPLLWGIDYASREFPDKISFSFLLISNGKWTLVRRSLHLCSTLSVLPNPALLVTDDANVRK